MLTRIIYSSRATERITMSLASSIVEAAVRTNRALDVTGMLCVVDSYFLQVLEGHRRPVSELMTKITADPRHHRLSLIQATEIEERQFARWDMGFAGNSDQTEEVLNRHVPGEPSKIEDSTGAEALALLLELRPLVDSHTRQLLTWGKKMTAKSG